MQRTHLLFQMTIDTFVVVAAAMRGHETEPLPIGRTFVLT